MPSINDLPTELLDAIVTALCGDHEPQEHPITCCVHRWYEWAPVEKQPPLLCDRQRQASLRSLCLTSRRFHAVTLPHLYHHLQPSSNWWRLAQTLALRPELARQVRSLRFEGKKQEPDDVDPWVWEDPHLRPLYEARRAEYLETCPEQLCWPGFGPAWQDGYEKKDDARRMTEFENCFETGHNLSLSLFTSMLPNLETLVATVGFAVAFRFNKPGSLPRLRHIHLYPDKYEWMIAVRRVLPRLFAAANESLESIILEYCSEHSRWTGRVYPDLRAFDAQRRLSAKEEALRKPASCKEERNSESREELGSDEDLDSDESSEEDGESEEGGQMAEQTVVQAQEEEEEHEEEDSAAEENSESEGEEGESENGGQGWVMGQQDQDQEEDDEDEHEEYPSGGPYSFICPRVAHLTLIDWTLHKSLLRHMLTSFPNVTHLHVQVLGPKRDEIYSLYNGFLYHQWSTLPELAEFFRRRSSTALKLQSFVFEPTHSYENWEWYCSEEEAKELR
ncbi:hypothetical protein VTJ49DRAFT_3853 [Mycothermus thermophilus]|uniref:F-box domain-containing protein n=1 Tax=Humicola insolens TaxID=85995 RepID=A0ABR3VQL4_HUMIN